MSRDKLLYLLGIGGALSVLIAFGWFVVSNSKDAGEGLVHKDSLCQRVFGYQDVEQYELSRADTVVGPIMDPITFERIGLDLDESMIPQTLYNKYDVVRDGEVIDHNFTDNIEVFAVETAGGFDATSQPGGLTGVEGSRIVANVVYNPDEAGRYCIKLKSGEVLDILPTSRGVLDVNSLLGLVGKSVLAPEENYTNELGENIAYRVLEDMDLDAVEKVFLANSDGVNFITEIATVSMNNAKHIIWVPQTSLLPGQNYIVLVIGQDIYQVEL